MQRTPETHKHTRAQAIHPLYTFQVAISSVYHTTLDDPNGGPPVGYIRVTQFSNSAADDVRAAVKDFEVGNSHAY